ncbi:hypothetical protein BC833DRAFT_588901 [Globomyces pollinis-pini]|nr:hypothetical protein BC833DRAFT_588901 [Globomyces pollinis-pini]KAJ2997114.1 hypothetical protein HDV02_005855 [Globomyces sp. JEL0801]
MKLLWLFSFQFINCQSTMFECIDERRFKQYYGTDFLIGTCPGLCVTQSPLKNPCKDRTVGKEDKKQGKTKRFIRRRRKRHSVPLKKRDEELDDNEGEQTEDQKQKDKEQKKKEKEEKKQKGEDEGSGSEGEE